MSIQNTGQRRISMFSFAGLFILAVSLSCIAFISSVRSKGQVSEDKLKEFESEVKAFEEKEQVLKELAILGQALQQYDENPTSGQAGECENLIKDLYKKVITRDSVLYQNVVHSLEMAEAYRASIEQRGIQSDQQVRLLRSDLAGMQEKYNQLQNDKNQLQMDLLQKQGDILILKNQLVQAQNKGGGGGGGGGAKDCAVEVNEHKMTVLQIAGKMQTNIQAIQNELDDINGVFGIGKNKKEKEKIDEHIQALEQNLAELKGN